MSASSVGTKRWPVVASVVGLVALVALGLAYWSNVQDRERYLQRRNFRLLAVLANQTESLIETRTRILHDPTDLTTDEYRLRGNRESLRLEAKNGKPSEPLDLKAIFAPKLRQGAFDTVVLATAEGDVIYAVGRRASEMSAMRVDALLPLQKGSDGKDVSDFPAVARSISERPVQLAGVAYRLFVQPCCRAVVTGDAASSGLLVLGLADAGAMGSASMAISPVLVLLGIAFVLAALVGWAFLKAAFIGAHHRVRAADVLQLGASSVFGLALATMVLLTMAAYARLTADVDRQLEQLAGRLDQRFSEEVKAAYAQATKMQAHLLGLPCMQVALALTDGREREAVVTRCNDQQQEELGKTFREPGQPYPTFAVLSLIDPNGYQQFKVAPSEQTRLRLVVADRGYFQQAKTRDGLWTLPQCPDGCVLESHWSWTTGLPQVALSVATRNPLLPVAALAFPMRSLISPVLPPGFEFAVIDSAGVVQFHSDKQRNVQENFLLETDQSPRLRSLMLAHSAGTVNMSYWGRPYRAYVKPAAIPGWSMISLIDKQYTRGLVLEWSTMGMLMQTAFMALWFAGMLIALKVGVSWLWPDPLRRSWYPWLTGLYAGGLVLWVAVASMTDVITIAWVGTLLPCALWLATYAVLARRLPGVEQAASWPDVRADYQRAGALLLAITAMVPAASFFAVSYDLHLEGFLKGRQIALASVLDGGAPCPPGRRPAVSGDSSYAGVFYRSDVTCASGSIPEGEASGWTSSLVHGLVEDYLPYLTSASIETRELLHNKAGDESWVSRRPTPSQLLVNVAARTPDYRIDVLSDLPRILAVTTTGNPPRLVSLAVLSLLLLGCVAASSFWVIGYLLRHVLLADVVEPQRRDEHVVTEVGQHLLVICDDPQAKAAKFSDVLVLELTPIVTPTDMAASWRKARVAIGEAEPVRPIVIPDVDDQLDDLAVTQRKMLVVAELLSDPEQTVVLLTRLTAPALAASVRDALPERSDQSRPALINRFTVVDTRTSSQTVEGDPVEKPPAGWWSRLRWLGSNWFGARPVTDWRRTLLTAEGRPSSTLRRICDEVQRTGAFQSGLLNRDQIVEEIEERAMPLYRREWQASSPDERVVLEHAARHGLASAPSRRVVRRLLAKGLLRKDPELRLMNESFRRFVLGLERRNEVAVLEAMAEPSIWDRVRMPLGFAAVASIVFLVSTQREAFDVTLAMAAGVTTAVPTLVKLTNLLAQFGASRSAPKSNA